MAAAVQCSILRSIDLFILLPIFVLMAIFIPLMDSQMCLPQNWDPIHPKLLTDLVAWYGEAYNDYLVIERPFFMIGLAWVETFFMWPLSIFCCYAILTQKSWFQNACLMLGVSVCTGMAIVVADLMGSGKMSSEMYQVYVPMSILFLIVTIRGILPLCCCSYGIKNPCGVSSNASRKKRT